MQDAREVGPRQVNRRGQAEDEPRDDPEDGREARTVASSWTPSMRGSEEGRRIDSVRIPA